MVLNVTLKLAEQVCDIAKRAGREIMKIYQGPFKVETKGESMPVTEADRVAEDVILRSIREGITDSFPIVSEEAYDEGRVAGTPGAVFWLVDPLDGTKEFIGRNGEFTVNVALIENGAPVLGVVHAPAIGATYWGSVNGAFAEREGEAPRPIACRPLPKTRLVALVSRSHLTPEVGAYLGNFDVADRISAGSSLKFCLVAEGRADIYPRFGRTMEWDTAAGHAVVRFAGGSVSDVSGAPLRYGKPGFENPDFIAKGAEAKP